MRTQKRRKRRTRETSLDTDLEGEDWERNGTEDWRKKINKNKVSPRCV